ncbi:MAG: hypothetical protein IT203_04580 [Fimbriimonadaceae bacterium]|nr:hypothetical protein [Fimbriimonadaceae bacterium]
MNKAVPAWLMTVGHSTWLPKWVQLLVQNLFVLALMVVMIDLGVGLWSRNRLSSLCLFVCGLGIPALSLLNRTSEAPILISLLAITLIALSGLASKRQLPFRAYHALTWLVGTMLMVLISLAWASKVSWPYNGWGTAAIEILAICAALAIFAAWGAPLRNVTLQNGIASTLVALAFALILGFGGHAANQSFQAVTGLALTLPLPVYTIAVFLLTCTCLSLLSKPETELRGSSLALLMIAGASLAGSEFAMLAIVALTSLLQTYPAREKSLWHDWSAVLYAKLPTEDKEAAQPL